MTTPSNNLCGSSAFGGDGTPGIQGDGTANYKTKCLSFVVHWLGVLFAVVAFSILMRLSLDDVSLWIPRIPRHIYIVFLAFCCAWVLGSLSLFVRHTLVTWQRDIGRYGPFIRIVAVLAFVLPIGGVVWSLFTITPSKFLPTSGLKKLAPHSLPVNSPSIAGTPLVPWSGTRDPSCAQYHNTKYKTPIYRAEEINDHLIQVLAVENTAKRFYRWEGPVRYYLAGPPEYPELVKLFEEQVAEVAKYTGLDIARHDKAYLPYKSERLNDKSKWPGGLSTNVVVIFTKDAKTTLQIPLMTKIVESLGRTVKREQADWDYVKKLKPGENIQNSLTYSYDPDRLVFVLQILESDFSDYPELQSKSNKLAQNSFANAMSLATKMHKGSEHIPSILYNEVYALTDFDKQFLRVLYGKHIHSGMPLLQAKRLMLEELVDCFNAKAGAAKR